MEVKPIITMKNFKRGTRVELLGIDISTALTNFDYSTQGEGSGNNAVTLEINIEELTMALLNRYHSVMHQLHILLTASWLNSLMRNQSLNIR